MFVDEITITLKGGHGGPGIVSFLPMPQRGPDGGNGGKGGSVYLKTVTDLTILQNYSNKRELAAKNGEPGGKNKSTGSDAQDVYLSVPVGTEIHDLDSGEIFELNKPDQVWQACKGGIGGRGNWEFRSSRHTTPTHAQVGLPGQVKRLKIILKLIADFGLIGLPNAGKSSLLNVLTEANAKIGAYPFTTLEPNLGVFEKKILADIPGLIEGASLGRGLGSKFLKHIEKTSILLHCIGADSEDLKKDYEIVRNELLTYSQILAQKDEAIIITKTDNVDLALLKKIEKMFKGKKVFFTSIYDDETLEKLKQFIRSYSPKPQDG